MNDTKQRREHVRNSLKWIRLRIAIAKTSGQGGDVEHWQKALAIFARQDKALVRVRTENKRLRRRWDQITGDPEGSRHLLRLLMVGKGTPDDFDAMIDRIIKSKADVPA